MGAKPGVKRTWDEAGLTLAVAGSTSWRQVAVSLGLKPSGGTSFQKVKQTAAELGLDTSHFTGSAWNKGKGAGRNRELTRASYRRWYERNRKSEIARSTQRKTAVRELIREGKAQPCYDCGCKFPYFVMDYDHRPSEAKEFSIGYALKGRYGLARIRAEIAKCDLVCSNCHRIRTARRMGWSEEQADHPDVVALSDDA